jgi:hypothetical protein
MSEKARAIIRLSLHFRGTKMKFQKNSVAIEETKNPYLPNVKSPHKENAKQPLRAAATETSFVSTIVIQRSLHSTSETALAICLILFKSLNTNIKLITIILLNNEKP